MKDIIKLINPHILELEPYSSARDEYEGDEGIFLDANENAFGSASPDSSSHWERYPDPHQKALKVQLAKIKNVSENQIFLGNGSDEAIDLIMRIFCQPAQDKIILLPPTYGMYQVSANLNNIQTIAIALTQEFQPNIIAIKNSFDAFTKLLFVCTPNNPTANCISQTDIQDLIESFDGIVIVDEAYIDFCPQNSIVSWLNKYENLIIIQTLSKAWGLASVRLGMAFANPFIIGLLNKIKPPYNISGPNQSIVLEALGQHSKVNQFVNQIIESRANLILQLNKIGPQVEKIYPSESNFLLVRFENAKTLFEFLIGHQIIVRDRSKVLLCQDCLRITVGTMQENAVLISQIQNFYN